MNRLRNRAAGHLPPAAELGRRGRRRLRWLVRHGAPRMALRVMAWSGSPVGQVLFGRSGQERLDDLHGQIRSQGPLVGGRGALATACYATTADLLRDPAYHAGAQGSSPLLHWAMCAGMAPDAMGPLDPPSLLVVDPPDHTRYRGLVSKVFTARAVAGARPQIHRIAEGLLDAIPASQPVDLVEAYAKRLPVAVIAHLMGIPQEMLSQFLDWSDDAAPALDLGVTYGEYTTADAALRQTNAWLREHFQRLRAGDGDDLLSVLVRSADQDGRLSEEELLATAQLMLAAGFVTMVDLLSSGAVLLLQHPHQLARLLAEPAGWPNAVEEILRCASPVQVTARFATQPGGLGGRQVRRGQAVVALLGGANRDPDVFPDPDTFDPWRANARDHVAFSRGLHHCLGSGLARLEGEIGLQALFGRFPGMTLHGEPVRRPGAVLRGFQQVMVRPGGAG